MSHVGAPSIETAAAYPNPSLEQAARSFRELYGQDFNVRAYSQDNHPSFRDAETDVLDQIDPLTITNRAPVLGSWELRRLFIDAVSWFFNAVARWNTRHGQRRQLSDLSDHQLRDIGIRRDQINTLVSGSLKEGTRL